jgi:hypothetical protein
MPEKSYVEISHKALAETAFIIALRTFPEETEDNHPVFRLSNLFQSEIEYFLEIWAERVAGTRLQKAKVIISHEGEGLYPPEFIADPQQHQERVGLYRDVSRK